MFSPWSKNCNKTGGEGLAPPAVEGGYHLPIIKQRRTFGGTFCAVFMCLRLSYCIYTIAVFLKADMILLIPT